MTAPMIAVVPMLLALSTASTPGAAPIEGYWKNPIGSAIIAIAPCGRAWCGKVAWASPRGRREASKSTPDVVGTMVLTGIQRAGGRWTGSLFIPDDDVHVRAWLDLIGSSQLKLTGCAFAGLFCRSQLWTRAEQLPVD